MTRTAPADQRIRVAVVFGGRSGEHPVSCISAASVLKHLDRSIFDLVAIGITRQGQWLEMDPDRVPTLVQGQLPEVTDGNPAQLRIATNTAALQVNGGAENSRSIDVIFPVLHGPYGEDGTVQGLFELADIPYVGPGVLASAVAMDKVFTKTLLESSGIATAPFAVVDRHESTLDAADQERLGLPVFVKPARAGSSLGVSKVTSWAQLPTAIATARKHDVKVLIESAIVGREIECGVLEYPDGQLAASPTAEIQLDQDRFYDFEAKYLEDVATFAIPAGLSQELETAVRDTAISAFKAIDAAGLARVDFFVTTAGEIIVNEINTLPGFTPISMYPQMWAAGGVDYPELLTILIRTALARGTGLR